MLNMKASESNNKVQDFEMLSCPLCAGDFFFFLFYSKGEGIVESRDKRINHYLYVLYILKHKVLRIY